MFSLNNHNHILLNDVSIRNVEDLQKLNEAVSLQNQVHEVRLQDKLGEQKYHGMQKNYLNR